MTFEGSEYIPGLPQLARVDVLPGTPEEAVAALASIHLENFQAHYAHAAADFRNTWRRGLSDPDIIEHQWLLLLDGSPAGECVFHVNIRRRVVARHFLAMNRSARRALVPDWIAAVMAAAAETALQDAESRGVSLFGMMSEITPAHAAGWRALGHVQPDIDYREPLHGNYWREFGDLTFVPMVANILPFPSGREAGLGVIAEAGVRAFLLDYYGVPESDPTFQAIIDRCRHVPPAW